MDLDIKIREIYKSFGNNQVLKGLALDLRRGENLVVLGKSGTGKSVLIKCIIGLMVPDSGDIEVLGKHIHFMSKREMDELRVDIGFLFQSNALYDSMTVRENLLFPLRKHKNHPKFKGMTMNELVSEALESVGLPHTGPMMPSELSGGMRKRIALARTLILRPRIILYDEPTTGLDPLTSKEICHLILKVQKDYNASSIIISHDINVIKIVSNRIMVLVEGVCTAQGGFEELLSSGNSFVKSFFE